MKRLFLFLMMSACSVHAAELEEVNFFVANVLQLNSLVRQMNICVDRTPMAQTARCWLDQTRIEMISVNLKNVRQCLSEEPGLFKALDHEQQQQLEIDLSFLTDIVPENLSQLRADAGKDLALLNPQVSAR